MKLAHDQMLFTKDLPPYTPMQVRLIKDNQQLGFIISADTETRKYKQQHPDGTVTEGVYDRAEFLACAPVPLSEE
jgi:hypothetical protein